MSNRRPLQYLGLFLLMAFSLAIIFFPIGAKPQPQDVSLTFIAPKPWDVLAGKGNTPADVADKAIVAAFKTSEKTPERLNVIAGGANEPARAVMQDRAATREEARTRARRIVQALSKPFPGIKLAPESEESIRNLPPQPLMPLLGNAALYPPLQRNGATVPAVKLGLDLQGGVNLVLQVRRALFTYKIDANKAKTLAANPDARDAFESQVRDALGQAGGDLSLDEADVNIAPGDTSLLEVRTQARDRAEFDKQRKAIGAVVANVGGSKLSEAREPQFYDAAQSVNNADAPVDDNALLDRTVEIVRSRVDSLGVSEPQIQKQLPDRIIVQLPGVSDPQRAVDVIGKTAQMSIYLLPQDLSPDADPNDVNNTIFRDKSGTIVANSEVIKRSGQPIVTGDDVKPTSRVGKDESGQWAVYFELQGAGSQRFGEATARNINRIMPIFLDENCISAPNINSAITGGSGQISGGFETADEARDLALSLNSGALPAPIDVVENRTISATLGEESLTKSLQAGLIGILAVIVFMIAFYRLAGALANCALVVYCILNLAAFILIGGTLTLPGIAGFLLAIAMSLDTNILVFERLREEMAIQPTFAAALRAAFSRAWTAILDSHVTTLIASIVLFLLGTGPVKGFALTLGIGVLLSLFSAISVTRLFMWSVANLGERRRSLFVKPVERAHSTTAAGNKA